MENYTTCRPNPTLFLVGREDLGLEDTDVGEVAVGSGVVETVSNDELVGHLESQVPHVEVGAPPGRFGEEGTDLQRGRLAGLQRAQEVRERQARIDYVLDDKDVPVRDVLFEVFEDTDDAAGGGARAVRAYVHEVQLALQIYVAHEVAHDHDRAAQDADEKRLLAPVILGDARPDLTHLVVDFLRGYEHFFHVGHHTGHTHENLSTSSLRIFSVVSPTLYPSPISPPTIQATSPLPPTTTGVLRLRSLGTFLSIMALNTFLVPPSPNGRTTSPSPAMRTAYGPCAPSR